MKWFVYIAKENSINEGQGFHSLLLIDTKDSWQEAYKVMQEEGQILREQGWEQGCCSRSEHYCNDNWQEPDRGQSWKDLHHIQLIASTSELRLAKIKGDQQ